MSATSGLPPSKRPRMKIDEVTPEEARSILLGICHSKKWVEAMMKGRPFEGVERMRTLADETWRGLKEADWLEAFGGHARIGDQSVTCRGAREQKGMAAAPPAVLIEFERLNETYEQRFGFIFLICATGKSSTEMLAALHYRIGRTREQELKTAVEEQARIIQLRLEQLV